MNKFILLRGLEVEDLKEEDMPMVNSFFQI